MGAGRKRKAQRAEEVAVHKSWCNECGMYVQMGSLYLDDKLMQVRAHVQVHVCENGHMDIHLEMSTTTFSASKGTIQLKQAVIAE